LIAGILKNGKRDLNNELDGDTPDNDDSLTSNLPKPQFVAGTVEEQPNDGTRSESEGSVDSDPFGVRTDWPPDDISSVGTGSLSSFNESSLDLRVLPRSIQETDSSSSTPSFGSSVATRDQFQQSIAPAIPGLELMLIPITIICWFKQLFEAFDRWPGPYREHQSGGTLGRRNHPRNWNTETE